MTGGRDPSQLKHHRIKKWSWSWTTCRMVNVVSWLSIIIGAFVKTHDLLNICSRTACGGESGWCSDVASTHGAWRHAGVRFLLRCDCIRVFVDSHGWVMVSLLTLATRTQAGRQSASARAWRETLDVASGHTASNAPDLFRTPKLSGAGPG